MAWAGSDAPIKAGEPTDLRFVLHDSTGAVASVHPYLGMAAHAVVVGHDGSVFIHLHPMGTVTPTAQQVFALRDRGDTTARGRLRTDELRPNEMADMPMPGQLTFPYEFPKPGRYRIWVQVKPKRASADGHVRRGRSLSRLRVRLFVAIAIIAAAVCVRLGLLAAAAVDRSDERETRSSRSRSIRRRSIRDRCRATRLPRAFAACGVGDAGLRARVDLRGAHARRIAGRQSAHAGSARGQRHGGAGQPRMGVFAGWQHDRHRAMARSRFDVHGYVEELPSTRARRTSNRPTIIAQAVVWRRVEGAAVSGAAVLCRRAGCGRYQQRGHAHRATDDSRSRRRPAPELRHSMVWVCGGRPRRSGVRDQAVALRRSPGRVPPRPVSTGGASGRG